MGTRLWDRLRRSYWFLPGCLAAAGVGLAFATEAVDRAVEHGRAFDEFVTRSPAGARELLATAAGSLITVAGVAFSITVVALALVARQLGTKVLRTLMRDAGSQAALGIFVAAFLYCLLVLRTVRGGDDGAGGFVPTVGIAVALLLTVASAAMLVYFLHHVATEIQADYVIAAIAEDLRNAVDRVCPDPGSTAEAADVPLDAPAAPVPAEASGYVVTLAEDRLLALATAHDLLVRVLPRPGRFVVSGEVVAEIRPAARATPRLLRRVRAAVEVGRQRLPVQDPEFAIEELVQIALRALAPGTNDPLTALACLNWLDAALRTYVQRPAPPSVRVDDRGRPRLLTRPLTRQDVAAAAFPALERASRDHPDVSRRLAELRARFEEADKTIR